MAKQRKFKNLIISSRYLHFDSNQNLALDLVHKNNKLSETDITAINFIFWISYYVEELLKDLTKGLIKLHLNIQPEYKSWIIDDVFEYLSFGNKIGLFNEIFIKKHKEFDEMIKFFNIVKRFRNDISHGKFKFLKYKNLHLSGTKAQDLFIKDLQKSLTTNLK